MAKVDIVIPCYNYGRFLESCVHSAISQQGVELRVTIIDDASTDQTAKIAEGLAARDPRVRLVVLPRNVGMIPAVNTGLRECDGDYFVKLDADDLLSPGSLKRSVELLERFPNVGFVYGRPLSFKDAHPRPALPGVPRWRIWSGQDWFKTRYQRAVNCISQPEVMVRTATLRAVGEFDPKLRHTSDLQMWLRLAAVADVGRINGVVQGFYRIHANSMQRTVNAGAVTDLTGRRDAFLTALSCSRLPIEEIARLDATVRRRLAAMALDHICWTYDRDRPEPSLTEQLIAFAIETWPAAPELPVWRTVQRWRTQGRRSRWEVGSLFSTMRRRSLFEMESLRRNMTGL